MERTTGAPIRARQHAWRKMEVRGGWRPGEEQSRGPLFTMRWGFKEKKMRVRAFYWMSLLVTALFLVGCGGGQATVKFQPGDQNVTPGQTMQWTFDTYSLGEIPKGAQSLSGRWEVRAVADAPTPPNALCQTGNAEFPALSLSPMVYTDVVISTRFKPISGQQDQAAGIIFRIQDANK